MFQFYYLMFCFYNKQVKKRYKGKALVESLKSREFERAFMALIFLPPIIIFFGWFMVNLDLVPKHSKNERAVGFLLSLLLLLALMLLITNYYHKRALLSEAKKVSSSKTKAFLFLIIYYLIIFSPLIHWKIKKEVNKFPKIETDQTASPELLRTIDSLRSVVE